MLKKQKAMMTIQVHTVLSLPSSDMRIYHVMFEATELDVEYAKTTKTTCVEAKLNWFTDDTINSIIPTHDGIALEQQS